jgi:hypothetical protein
MDKFPFFSIWRVLKQCASAARSVPNQDAYATSSIKHPSAQFSFVLSRERKRIDQLIFSIRLISHQDKGIDYST